MCGRVNVTDDPFVKRLSEALGIKGIVPKTNRDIAPASKISIVRHIDEQPCLQDALWWLCLDDKSLKPNYRYASFNSRSDKLNKPGSLAFKPFRKSRCIIPASGFVEGLGDKKHYFQIEPESKAIAFGGLYKEWLDLSTGEIIVSASIITLPPHPKLANVHPKSLPLMLPYEDSQLVDAWLTAGNSEVEQFASLLEPKLNEGLKVTPIDRPSSRKPVGDSFYIESDLAA